MWNRLRYTVWALEYDLIANAAGFDAARRLSTERLPNRVLILDAGTRLNLPQLRRL
jgi:hypothetical protein